MELLQSVLPGNQQLTMHLLQSVYYPFLEYNPELCTCILSNYENQNIHFQYNHNI